MWLASYHRTALLIWYVATCTITEQLSATVHVYTQYTACPLYGFIVYRFNLDCTSLSVNGQPVNKVTYCIYIYIHTTVHGCLTLFILYHKKSPKPLNYLWKVIKYPPVIWVAKWIRFVGFLSFKHMTLYMYTSLLLTLTLFTIQFHWITSLCSRQLTWVSYSLE